MDYILTDHCLLAMLRRGIEAEQIAAVLLNPERTETLRPGRAVCQAEMFLSRTGRVYLLRVVVDIDRDPAEVVTVYRPGRAGRYRRERT
jgi:hypothetical protein